MLRKLKSTRDTQYNASAYDEVWLVFDEDGKDRSSLFAKCSHSSNKTKYAGLCVVVSQSRVGYETRHKCVFQVEV